MIGDVVMRTLGLDTGYRNRGEERRLSRGLELELRQGEVISLIGPNGSGKSTLLRTLAGIQSPLGGSVELDGQPLASLGIRERARSVAVVLTGRTDSGFLTVRQLVGMGRYPYTGGSGRLTSGDAEIVERCLERTGAAHLAGRRASRLSDGEFQKVMIARALAQEPRLLILDEPAAFLDLTRRVELMHMLRRIARTEAKAILLSSHDLELVLRSSDRVWLMENDGAVRLGAPEDLVLGGVLEEVFQGEGLVFDRDIGAFISSVPAIARARVDSPESAGIPGSPGEQAADWTRRALTRIGIDSLGADDTGAADFRIRIRHEGAATLWELEKGGSRRTFSSLYDLVTAVEAASSGPAIPHAE
jgi:iron complex transport system ATP-binding protein